MVSSGIRVVCPVEFGAPHLNNLRKPLEKDQLDLLVQFCNPVFKVGVTFQVQPIDLLKDFRQASQVTNPTHGSLDLVQQLSERFGGV